ncbi:unnamed protein product [Paramecium sonneborni]|uniref:Protein kinase domain-containing protein n=1 Tax=Paramecium sonneborni TaxID=65129 RepID=A0A8S1PAZ3_9CILI|nr:unnamed protein product [Paramecium sonneborni]
MINQVIAAPSIDSPERKFKIINNIGFGSQGEIYQVEAINWKNNSSYQYALKKQQGCSQHEIQAIQRIIEYQQNSEVNWSTYQSSQLIRIFDLFKLKEDVYLVMELGEQDLHQYLVQQQMLPLDQKHKIMKQLCFSLQFVHQYLLSIHRDIKPENFIKVGDQFKLIDFGTVRLNTFDKKTIQIGTVLYQAPEMILGNSDYTYAVDIWSLGCVLYEFFSLEPLFQGKNLQEVRKKIIECQSNQNYILEKIKQLQVCDAFKNLLILILQPNPNKRLRIDQIIYQLNDFSITGPFLNKFSPQNPQNQNQNQNSQLSNIRFQTSASNNQFQPAQLIKFLQDFQQQFENQQKEQKVFQQEILTTLKDQKKEQEQSTSQIVTQEFKNLKNKFKTNFESLKTELSERIDQINKDSIIIKEQKKQLDDLQENKAQYEQKELEMNQKIQELTLQIQDLNNQILFLKDSEQNLLKKIEVKESEFKQKYDNLELKLVQEIQKKQNQIELLQKSNQTLEDKLQTNENQSIKNNYQYQQTVYQYQCSIQQLQQQIWQNQTPMYAQSTINIRKNQQMNYPELPNNNPMFYQQIQELQKNLQELQQENSILKNRIKYYENNINQGFDFKFQNEIAEFRKQLQTFTNQNLNFQIKNESNKIYYFFDQIENQIFTCFENQISNLYNLLELIFTLNQQSQGNNQDLQNIQEKVKQFQDQIQSTKDQLNKNRQQAPLSKSPIKLDSNPHQS